VNIQELKSLIREQLEERKKKQQKGQRRARKVATRKKKKAAAKKDACYHKVKSRYKVWPSAYASGALVKCRKVGAKNWGNSTNEELNEEEEITASEEEELLTIKKELEAASKKHEKQAKQAKSIAKASQASSAAHKRQSKKIGGMLSESMLRNLVIEELNEKKKKSKKRKKRKLTKKPSSETNLGDWFKRQGAEGSKGGWVDCNAPDGKGGYKSCGRQKGEKRKKYPACRPTPAACRSKGKGKNWGKKAASRKIKEEETAHPKVKSYLDSHMYMEPDGLQEEWSDSERETRKSKCANPKGFTMKQFCKNQRTRSKKGQKTN